MSALTLFLLAVSLSMDAFAVSVCGGLKMEGRERFKGGLIFGAWFGVFQALMPLVGYELGSHFAKVAEAYSHWIIFLILSYIGWNMIQEAGEDQEKEKVTGFQTMLGLAVATSLDALGVGVGFAFLVASSISLWIQEQCSRILAISTIYGFKPAFFAAFLKVVSCIRGEQQHTTIPVRCFSLIAAAIFA